MALCGGYSEEMLEVQKPFWWEIESDFFVLIIHPSIYFTCNQLLSLAVVFLILTESLSYEGTDG